MPAQTDSASVSASGQQGQQPVVTDVIEQILELAEPVSIENHQNQQSGQPLNIAVGINRDILQVSMKGMSGDRSASFYTRNTVDLGIFCFQVHLLWRSQYSKNYYFEVYGCFVNASS